MNINLITRLLKLSCILGLILLLCSSCDTDSNPVAGQQYRMYNNTEEDVSVPCCVYPPEDINLMMAQQQEDNDLPWPMIVGGTQVDPA